MDCFFFLCKNTMLTLVICSSSLPYNNNPKVFSTQKQTFTPGEEVKTFKIFSWIDFFPLIQYKSLQIFQLPTLSFKEP